MAIFENFSRGIPVSASACDSLTNWRDRNKNNLLARYVIAEISFAGICVLGALEGLASSVCFLALKTITCLIPQQYFDRVHADRAYAYASRSMTTAQIALVSLVDNITKDQLGNNILITLENAFASLFNR